MKWACLSHTTMQATDPSTDFNCLPPDINAIIAANSGQVWRALACVDHTCSGILSWKEYVQRFTTVGVVTKLRLAGQIEAVIDILDPGYTWIKLLDGAPHSDDDTDTWIVEAGTRYSTNFSMVDIFEFGTRLSGVYRRGVLVRANGPLPFSPVSSIEWKLVR